MPSATHQNFLLLFSSHPELAFELARRAGVPLADSYERLEETAAEFDDPLLLGNTVRADLALVGHHNERPRHALAIETQLGEDVDKEWTLALYRAALRRKLRCPAWVLWFSPDAKVRASVHERMCLEEPELRPHVVTPEMIPVIRDLDTALANYPWAVLAATIHREGPDAILGAKAAIQALLRIAPVDCGRYIQLVAASIGKDAMQQVREQLPPEELEPLSEWERQGASFLRGHEEGLEQGLEEGLEHALVQMRATLRSVLEARGLPIARPTQERIAACVELDELSELIIRAATVANAEELFAT